MEDKEIWAHLSKELAKANTILDLSQRILKSPLFTRTRYNIFISTVLDSYTRVIFLSIYYLFDKRFSWCLYSLTDLTVEEKDKIEILLTEAKKYIDIRHTEIGHSSRKVKLEQHRRLQWLTYESLEEIKEFFKKTSRFINSYGMRKFNEGYSFHYGGPGTSLQCLIEDLVKLESVKS